MRVADRASEVQAFVRAKRQGGASIGLVPTMGALHEGHLALVGRSVAENDVTLVSIFVNPAQFGPQEDLSRYPRPFERDVELCRDAGVGLVFAPEPEEMYPEGFCTSVTVAGLTEGLCGRFRPEHFEGVTTVVSKLLNIAQADRAYFGDKDFQQLAVIRRMVTDLNMAVEIVSVTTAREADGLALSSRNRYLSAEQRAIAPALHQALQAAAEAARAGATGAEAERIVTERLAAAAAFRVQYVEAVDPCTLRRREAAGAPMVIAAAAYLGDTRLIDNVRVEEVGTC